MADFDFNDWLKKEPAKKAQKEKQKHEDTQKPAATRTVERHHTKRIASESALSEVLDWHFVPGSTYHCISHGDIDSLSYLRLIVKQQRLYYLLISTWCMAVTDAEEIADWLRKGYVARVDFYVGEIFHGSYAGVYQYIREHCLVPGARICVSRNHSKVMVGYGERFDFTIESSANVNTNPRIEQASIIIGTQVCKFYKDFYDGLNPFNEDECKDFKIWDDKK